jgi:hypothetical protein
LIIPGDWADWRMQAQRDEPAACRDGMLFLDKRTSRYVIYYTATMADGRACIGTSISENLLDWKDNGPTYVEDDRTYNRLESPYLCEDRGRFYLFYSGKVSDPVLMRFEQDGTLRLAEHVSPGAPRRRASLDRFVWYEREKDPVAVVLVEPLAVPLSVPLVERLSSAMS